MAVKQILGGSFEFVKDTVKQVGKLPLDVAGGMMEQAIKGGQQTPAQKQQAQQQMQQKISDHTVKDEEELKKTREALAQLRRMNRDFAPKATGQLRPGEVASQTMEQKKALAVEAQKKQSARTLPAMYTKPQAGSLGRRKAPKGSEGLTKDSKTG